MNLIKNDICPIIVDYAHNGLSAEALYKSLKEDFPGTKIKALFGCPGNKGHNRRREMGEAAGKYADYVYLTAEDPGNSTVEEIANDIIKYISKYHNNYEIIVDRKEAIEKAIKDLTPDDVLDKKTGIQVEDPYVHSISYMANNWMLALGITNATPKDIEKAFNPGNAVIFDDVMQALKRDYTEQGNNKRRFPTEYCVYESSKRIVEKFLATPEKYEKVYEYFKYLGSSNYYQVFKGKSFNELNDSRYLEHQAEKAASRIVR